MDRDEIIDLLTIAIAFDQRSLGEGDITAWGIALEGTGFEEARAAIIAHYREQARRIMPADIRQHVKQNQRPDAVPFAQLPRAEPDEPNPDFLKAKAELIEKMKRRDQEALRDALRPPTPVFAEQDPGERAAAWIDRKAGPSKYPARSDINIPAADRWVELPNDPPELRKWLAAQRRAARTTEG